MLDAEGKKCLDIEVHINSTKPRRLDVAIDHAKGGGYITSETEAIKVESSFQRTAMVVKD